MYNLDSRLDEVLNNPIGSDLLKTILEQLQLPEITINNIVIGSISLRMLMNLSKGTLDEPFLLTLCDILNHEEADFVAPKVILKGMFGGRKLLPTRYIQGPLKTVIQMELVTLEALS